MPQGREHLTPVSSGSGVSVMASSDTSLWRSASVAGARLMKGVSIGPGRFGNSGGVCRRGPTIWAGTQSGGASRDPMDPGESVRPEAVWREAEPRLGMARVKGYVGRLRPGIVVTVTELTHDDLVAQVETDWGLCRRMFCHHLDFGMEFRTKTGEWVFENDSRALRFLRRVRDELGAGKPERHVGDFGRKLDAEMVGKILRRNGQAPA